MKKLYIFSKLRKKLWVSIFLLVASITVISMIIISAFLLNKLQETMHKEFEEKGLIIAKEFARFTAENLLIEDTVLLKKQLVQFFASDEFLYATLFEPTGLQVAEYSKLKAANKTNY